MTIWAYGKRKPKIDPTAWVFPTADVIGRVRLGKLVYVGAGAVIRGDYGRIRIGDGTAVEENVTIHARMSDRCKIEENVTIGHAAVIHNCTLRKNCVIGMNAVISDYAEVGEGAIVAEGAVVKSRSKIAHGMIAAGVPAKEIKPVPENVMKFWMEAKEIYKDLARKYPEKLQEIG